MILYIDEDYGGERMIINVPAGTVSQSFVINITDDDIVEHNELFGVTIVSVSTCGVTIGNINTSDVIIINDDGEYVHVYIQMYVCIMQSTCMNIYT